MFEYVGAVHIHSRYSDGSGSLRQIVKAARRAGVEFIVISDHNNMSVRKEGSSGWHDGVLVLIGEEVSPYYNHYMAIGIKDEIAPNPDSAQANIDAVAHQGGIGFIAHPFCYHRPSPGWAWLDKLLRLDVTVYPWRDLRVKRFDGIEVWQYMYDWVKSVNSFNIFAHVIAPERFITGPNPETLRLWDEACATRKVVGIGTLDAHAKPRILGMFPICSYKYLMGTVRTHILVPEPFGGTSLTDERSVLESLRRGCCFFANDRTADSAGFRFYIKSGGATYQMGDECELADDTELCVILPRDGEIRVVRDGVLVLVTNGESLCRNVRASGVLRVEARIKDKPWIFSNAIYVA
ncbi:MAG TPA: CehA/McbA family metallohydrolase [bacterium]|nr:CehA/McbA family metallohydrolase [bacterium]